jgi:catechol 2,3-dioxygenase-like lactoylglutathione lyase family enzyme
LTVAEPRISLVTLGVGDLTRSRAFYTRGFGWEPVFANDEIVFYDLGGVLLATFLQAALEEDMARSELQAPGRFALAHNVRAEAEVEPLLDTLVAAGGTLLRPADAPTIGGLRGYVADPDENAWEIAYNPAFGFTEDGRIVFGT